MLGMSLEVSVASSDGDFIFSRIRWSRFQFPGTKGSACIVSSGILRLGMFSGSSKGHDDRIFQSHWGGVAHFLLLFDHVRYKQYHVWSIEKHKKGKEKKVRHYKLIKIEVNIRHPRPSGRFHLSGL